MKKITYSISLGLILAFTGCSKDNPGIVSCEKIKGATAFSNSPVTIGQKLIFGTQDVGEGGYYTWTGPNNFSTTRAKDSVIYADLKNEGWYYLYVANQDNSCKKYDSVYVDIKLQQGTAPCSITANTTDYSNLGGDTYTYIYKDVDRTYSQKELYAWSSFTNITIYFHTYWRDKEPEDGIYTTYNNPLFDQSDIGYNQVFITTTKSSIYWSSRTGQNVYVSHVNGKLQVKFCNITMSGYNGTSYTTVASGNVLEK